MSLIKALEKMIPLTPVLERGQCTLHDPQQAATLLEWIEGLDGKARVASKLGVDVSTLYRYGAGKEAVPGWLMAYKKLSEENAKIRDENSALKRELKRIS